MMYEHAVVLFVGGPLDCQRRFVELRYIYEVVRPAAGQVTPWLREGASPEEILKTVKTEVHRYRLTPIPDYARDAGWVHLYIYAGV